MQYNEGVKQLQQAGASASLIRLLQSGENSYTRSKLKEALQALLPQKTPKPTTNAKEAPADPSGSVQAALPNEEPPVIIELKQKALIAFKEMSALHQQLTLLPTDDKRGAAAKRIVELDEVNSEYWRLIDEWRSTGRLPEQDDDPTTWSTERLVRENRSIPVKILYYKSKLQRSDLPDTERAAAVSKITTLQALQEKVNHAISK